MGTNRFQQKNSSPLYASKSRNRYISQCAFLLVLAILGWGAVPGSAQVTITPVTWDIVGLDATDVSVGPNRFPIGARVCNTGGAATATVNFIWDDGLNAFTGNPYINLRSGSSSTITLTSIPPGACLDAYFEVDITRIASAYDRSRSYHIIADVTGFPTVSTPVPRQIYVEHLVPRDQNSVSDMKLGIPVAGSCDTAVLSSLSAGATTILVAGNQYCIQMVGSTSSGGQDQIQAFLNLSQNVYQVLKVKTAFTVDTSMHVPNPSDKIYGDACAWGSNPVSPDYRSCTDAGKAGGNMTVTYLVQILSAPATNPEALYGVVHDFSGASYHYNADFDNNSRNVFIFNPANPGVSMSRSFSPSVVSAGSTSNLSFTIVNRNPIPLTGVSFLDNPFPSPMAVANPATFSTSGCGSAIFNPTSGATTLSFTNGQVGSAINAQQISSATEAGTTATITTVAPHGYTIGQLVGISGVSNNSYNGVFTIISVPTSTTFTYTAALSGLIAGSGGTAVLPGTCTVNVRVSVAAPGTYTLTSQNLFVFTTVDTSSAASATLNVTSAVTTPITCGYPAAQWIFDDLIFGRNENPSRSFVGTNVNGAIAAAGLTGVLAVSSIVGSGNPGSSWSIVDAFPRAVSIPPPNAPKPFFEFAIETSTYSSLYLSFDYNFFGNDWRKNTDNRLFIYYSTDGNNFTHFSTIIPTAKNAWLATGILTVPNPGATTFIRILPAGRSNGNHPLSQMMIDNVRFYGCGSVLKPTITKTFSPNPISINGASRLTFTVTNPNNNAGTPSTISSASEVASTVAITTSTPHGFAVGQVVGISGVTNNGYNGVFQIATVPTTTTFTYTDSFAGLPPSSGGTATRVSTPPGPSVLTGVTFTDTIPPGMHVASPTGATISNCGTATWSPVAGSNSLTFGTPTTGTATFGTPCTVSVVVNGTAYGKHTNISGFISSVQSGSNTTTTGSATDTLTVLSPAQITKSFADSTIIEGATTTLTFSITNPNTNNPLTNVAFTDSLQGGLTVASIPLATSTCGGTLSAVPGSPLIRFGSIAAISSASESGNTVTITTSTVHGFNAGQTVVITGVGVSGYNGSFTVATPTSNTFTYTNTITGLGGSAGGNAITGGGGLSPGDTCVVKVDVTAPTGIPVHVAIPNTTSPVLSTGGTGNTASAVLHVRIPYVAIGLLKQVSTSPGGPWWSFRGITLAVTNAVYYQFTIENNGEVDLASVNVTDNNVDMSTCTPALPTTLTTADPVKSCIVGPIFPAAGVHPNTATASGTYNTRVVTDTSTAVYSTAELTIVKTVQENFYTAAGDILHYTYGVTNTGDVPLPPPITITDSKIGTFQCSGFTLAVGDTVSCTANYTVVEPNDVTNRFVTNSAFAVSGPLVSNTVAVTVPYVTTPGLVITKSNAVNTVPFGGSTTYTITVTNNGPGSGDGAIVHDPVDAGLIKTNAGNCIASGGAVCPPVSISVLEGAGIVIATLPAGGSISFEVTATVTETGDSVATTATVIRNANANYVTDVDAMARNFGHLPAGYANMNLESQDGARHLTGKTYLGATVPVEVDGVNNVNYSPEATDDGVFWTGTWNVGPLGGTVDITAVCPSAPCYLAAWIDWNNNNSFNDTGDRIFANQPIVNGLQTLHFDIPLTADLNGTFYPRVRLYAVDPGSNPTPNDSCNCVGEVEDPILQLFAGIATPVTVSYFSAQRDKDSVRFDWSTATETGNVGFNLYAQKGGTLKKINKVLIPSQVIDSLHRTDYSFTAGVKGNIFYIEDVSVRGKTRRHGPFAIGTKNGARLDVKKIEWGAIGSEDKKRHRARQKQLRAEMARPISASTLSSTAAINLKVSSTGIYRVTYEMLLNAGLDLSQVLSRNILLTNRGHALPLYTSGTQFGPGSYFEFYGEALDSIYTRTNIYTVQVSGAGVSGIPVDATMPLAGAVPPASYAETILVNHQRAYADYTPSDDPWYDTFMLAFSTPITWDFPFQVDGLADPYVSATMDITVWGVTDFPQSPDHHLVASVNGTPIADERFDGLVEKRINVALSPGALVEGANTLQLTLPGDLGVDWDVTNFDKFSIDYQRLFKARNGQLTFTASGNVFKVTDLPDSNIVVYRKNDRGIVRLASLMVKAAGTTYTVTFAGSAANSTYFVSTAGSLLAPAFEATRVQANLNTPAKYLIISHPNFLAGLQPLVQTRQAQGLSVSVVDVNDIYSRYSYGIFDPYAIKQYIAYAAQNLGVRYVLLVGGDTYDYLDYLGIGSISFIPSLYAADPLDKFIPSDPLYADLNQDNVPDLAIGRFPVRTTAELDLLIHKTLAYGAKDYGSTATFAADLADQSVSFKAMNNSMIAGMPAGWSLESINLDDTRISEARTQLIAAMNRGTSLVTFTGHSGPMEWTFSNLFTTTDAAELTNAGRPFVVAQWGCWNTYYVDPENNYLVNSFLFEGDKGAAAVLGSLTLTDSTSEGLLGKLLLPRLAIPGNSIGQALLDAKNQLATTHPELLDVLLGWTLMGDPALTVDP